MFKSKKNVFLIHGAWSNKNSFNYITNLLDHSNLNYAINFEYNSLKQDIEEIIDNAKRELEKDKTPTIIVAHSMGGLIGLTLHDSENCSKIITLASPLSGIKIDPFFSGFVYNRAPILKDLAPRSKLVDFIKKQKYSKPIHCMIACKGFNPFIAEPSDGIVTIRSQESWVPSTAITTHLDVSHHEILQTPNVVNAIKKYLK